MGGLYCFLFCFAVQHNLNTTSTQPQHNLNTTSTQPQHNLNTTSTQPQHNLNTTSTQPQPNLNTTSTQPQHNLNSTSAQPQHNLNTTSARKSHACSHQTTHFYSTALNIQSHSANWVCGDRILLVDHYINIESKRSRISNHHTFRRRWS